MIPVFASLQGYFEGLGFEIPAHMNPADAYLDIVAGAIQPSSGAALDIAACWQARQAQQGAGASPIIVPGSRGGGAVTSAVQGLGFAAGVPGQEAQVLLEGCPEQGAAVVAIAASRRTSQQGGQQAGRVSAARLGDAACGKKHAPGGPPCEHLRHSVYSCTALYTTKGPPCEHLQRLRSLHKLRCAF